MEKGISDKIPSVLRQQAQRLAKHHLFDVGAQAKIGQYLLLSLVLSAALTGQSLEYRALSHADFTSDVVFHHLNNKVSVESAEAMLNSFVSRRDVKLLRRRFGGRRVCVAIDFTDEMFYGEKGTFGVVGTKRNKGTNHAFKYMTVNIVTPKGRFFIWAYPMFDRKETLWLLNKALMKMEELGIGVHLILLDREFNYTDALALIGEKYRYIIPADQDSKFKRYSDGIKLPAYCADWQITNKEKETVVTQLIILEEEGHRYGYLTNLPKKLFEDDMHILSELYGKRWGIETAHRGEDEYRIYTTCKKAETRYLFFVFSVLLYNLGIWLNLFFFFGSETASITIAMLKDLGRQVFEEFFLWLRQPQRWFSMQAVGNTLGRAFCLLF